MTRKAKALSRHLLALSPDSIRPIPTLPDAEAVLKMGFHLTPDETTVIRMAMALHSASKQPKLLWNGWRHIGVAVAIGTEHARKAAGGRLDTPEYRRVMGEFLRKTGFTFLNKNDRALAVRMLPRWEEINAWRSSLPSGRRAILNNPREVWAAYVEHRKKLGDPEAKGPPHQGRHHRQFPSMLEQIEALMAALESAEERRDRAEQERDFFGDMMKEIAGHAKLGEDDLARIRAKVRASREPLAENDAGTDDGPL